MRYQKGCIALSRTRDYPLLRQVLRASFITHSQLFEFMRLDYCETSRHAFNNRVLRLVRKSLLLKHEVCFLGRGAVYSIADLGASHLVGMGESYAGPIRGLSQEKYPAGLEHALELNDIHLALKGSGDLVTWTAETEIRSRNELTTVRLGKNYDALVRVRVGEVESRFALEYERTPKAEKHYLRIRSAIDSDLSLDRFLYLVPNYDVMAFVSKYFWDARHQVCFGLVKDFLDRVLETQVTVCGRGLSAPLNQLLASSRPS